MIRDLLPLSAYEQTDRAAWWRTVLMMGVLWGTPMTIFAAWREPTATPLAVTVVVGAFFGLMFGILWTSWFGRSMRKMVRRIYAADPKLVPPAPEGEYEYRLACTYLGRIAVGGHLYVGPREWTFVPHRKNLKMHQAPITIALAPSMSVEVVEVQLRGLPALLMKGPAYRVRVVTPRDDAAFVTPEPHTVAEALREYVPREGGPAPGVQEGA